MVNVDGVSSGAVSQRRVEMADYCECDRCGVEVDRETAYTQIEKSTWHGQRISVTAHYCDKCAATLRTVGAGEHSAMDDRRS